MNGIEFFLTHQVQAKEDHSKGYPWYVLDSERLHEDILQILFNESPVFAQSLLGFAGKCRRQPENGIFDLVLYGEQNKAYLEIKVWQKWTESQQSKQVEFLRRNGARGVLVLLAQQAEDWPEEDVRKSGGGVYSRVSYAELYKALDAIISATTGRSGLLEFTAAYKSALRQQELRQQE